MITIKRSNVDRKKLVLLVGDKSWHVSYKEARHLLMKLKQLKVEAR